MSVFMEFFLFFVTILQFLFPFAFDSDTTVPENPGDSVIEQETVIPDDHTHSGGRANCLQKAICSVCGEEYGELGDHIYRTTTKAPTCKEQGYTVFTCRLCLHTENGDYTPVSEHSYTSYVKKPSCLEGGMTYYTCSNCGHSYSDSETEALGHDYEETKVDATCIVGGHIEHTCKNCGDTYGTDYEDATGHSYTPVITMPTCYIGGYTTYICEACGDSYTGDETEALGHSYTKFIYNNDATCTKDGTEYAICDNGCGNYKSQTSVGSMLPHVDENTDTYCDNGNEKLYIDFTYLQYTEEAIAQLGTDVSLSDFIGRADEDYAGGEEYAANKGTSYNSIIESPYFTVEVNGKVNGATTATYTQIPVYGTTVFIGETQKGALHSFSEIYIEKDEYATFEIEITGISRYITIQDAVILPESSGEKATVSNGTVKAVLSGFGTHTFLFNGEDQSYAYTITVREEVNENEEIQELRAAGYEVYVAGSEEGDQYPAYIDNLEYIAHIGNNNLVIYLRKGSYLVAPHKYDINSSTDDSTYTENANSGIGQSRYPYITANGVTNYKILGYGAIDLGRLDRSERRGMAISFASNVEIRGIKIFNSPQWTFITYRCDNLSIKDVDIYGYRLNSDAFDICNSKNVTVEGCFVRSGDDCFVVKCLGGDSNAITDGVTVQNCYAWAGKARAFGIFGEVYNTMSNVTFKDNVVLYHDATWDYYRIPAIGIIVEDNSENAGNSISNVTFENIEICRNKAAAMHCLIFSGATNFNISGVTFKDISYKAVNTIENDGNTIPAVNTVNKFNDTSSIANVVVENIVCGSTKVTMNNYLTYFDENILVYCETIK